MWNLYQNEKFLEPLKFSNGKTQEDVVKEVLDAIKDDHKIIFIHGICGTGKCLDKESLIFCKPEESEYFSYHKIMDLECKKGKIMSLNPKGNIVESSFKNVRKTGKKKLYKLKTRTGREIIVSPNHPFLTITKKGIEWVPLEKLDLSSYICLPNKIETNKEIEFDENKIKILAHLIAEGKLGDTAGSPRYYQCPVQNLEVREDYENALKDLFPDGEIKDLGMGVAINFRLMNTTKGTTNKLRLFIREHGLDGKKSGDKFVPPIIFNLSKRNTALFLSRLFSGDGSIYVRKKTGQIVVEYSSISKKLIKDVSLLLNKFGVLHTITSKKFRDNKNYAWRISISNHEHLKKFIEQIGFIGKKQQKALKFYGKLKTHKFTNLDKVPRIIREYLKELGYNYTELDRFLNYEEIEKLRKDIGFKKIRKNPMIKTPFVFNQQKIDFLRQHIGKINDYIKDETLSFICKEDIFWDKIKNIDYIKEDETYDLEVPNNHNFIANGIIVHNSAIALNIAKNLGKSSVVVPGKNLQNQYKKDYERDKYILKDNGEKLKISVITGRNNHGCKFLEDNQNAIPVVKKEVNLKLHDIFAEKRKEMNEIVGKDLSADNYHIPCKIEIKEKNWNRIKQYLKQNKNVNINDFDEISDVKRASVGAACPYWSPVLPEKYDLKQFKDNRKKKYMGLNNTEFVFYMGKQGCKFYEQFNSFVDSDIIVFNSMKYKLESALNRKPLTEVEIIDECDEFLDSFSNQRNLNIDRLQNSLIHVLGSDEKVERSLKEIGEIIKQIKRNKRISDAVESKEIIPLKATGIYDLFKVFLNSPEFFYEIDDGNYLLETEEIARTFEDFMEESYLTVSRRENNLIVSIVTTNLAKKFREMVDKNKRIVLMSGTLHSKEVLMNIFGLDSFKIIEAEVEQQGRIEVQRTGFEMDCKYSNFNKKFSREDYLKALEKCVEKAKKPVLVHVNGFNDLPTRDEIKQFDIEGLISREELRETQREDNTGELVEKFKKGEMEVLFSTRCARGIDFPGEECNSIVLTKYPNPNVQDVFWKILAQTKPQHYWSFYKDKARRELWQKIYRGLRFKEDHIYVLSPDTRVLEAFEGNHEVSLTKLIH